MAPLKWGIVSAGKISFDFACASRALSPEEHRLVAVAARNIDSAKDFAKTFSIAKAYGSYDELFNDAEIDAVYIGSVNPTHLSLCKKALDAGKHVLCEKPLCINVKETKEVLSYAKEKKKFFMEAIWSRFFPAYQRLLQEVKKDTIGDVLQVFVSFGVPIAEVDRVKLKELGGGGVLDIGIYCVQLASFIFGGEKPQKVIAGGHLNVHGVDSSTSSTLLYSGGRTATLVTHCKVRMPNEAFVVGTKGTLKLEGMFHCATKLTLPTGETLEFPLPLETTKTNFDNSMGLSYQCQEVRSCINAGKLQSSVVSHDESLVIAEILEDIRKQVGVVYPQDA